MDLETFKVFCTLIMIIFFIIDSIDYYLLLRKYNILKKDFDELSNKHYALFSAFVEHLSVSKNIGGDSDG